MCNFVNDIVYFITNNNGSIKIGYTGCLKTRLCAVQLGCDTYCEIIATIKGGKELERQSHEYFKDTQYVVASSQADGDRKTGVNVWECPDSAQGNLCRVTNWIIDNCPTKWLIITDDDLSWIGRYNGNKHKKLSEQEAIEQIENSFLLAEELGVPFWGMNCIPDKGAYREYTPFSFNNYIGGPFQGFILQTSIWDTMRGYI